MVIPKADCFVILHGEVDFQYFNETSILKNSNLITIVQFKQTKLVQSVRKQKGYFRPNIG